MLLNDFPWTGKKELQERNMSIHEAQIYTLIIKKLMEFVDCMYQKYYQHLQRRHRYKCLKVVERMREDGCHDNYDLTGEGISATIKDSIQLLFFHILVFMNSAKNSDGTSESQQL